MGKKWGAEEILKVMECQKGLRGLERSRSVPHSAKSGGQQAEPWQWGDRLLCGSPNGRTRRKGFPGSGWRHLQHLDARGETAQ